VFAACLLAANALMFAVAGIVALRPFWQKPGGSLPKTPHEAPWPMLVGPVVLAVLGAVLGLYPDPLQIALIDPTVASLTGTAEDAKELQLWAGVNMPLILSIATIGLGAVLYLTHRRLRAACGLALGCRARAGAARQPPPARPPRFPPTTG
ncbi:MAG: hypothetical protein AAFR93_17780, partial [Pseudomonadota bacterium]